MNIFNKITLQSLRNNRSRTIVTIIGVMLSTVMITAVVALAISLQSYMVKGAEVKYGEWHVEVVNADAEFVMKQTENNQVTDVVTIENLGYAVLQEGQNPDKPYLFVTGWNQEALEALPVNLISGRLPENNNEVVIPAHIASNGGVNISVGDKIMLSIAERTNNDETLNQNDVFQQGEVLVDKTQQTYTVVGICQRPAIEAYSAPAYTIITISDDIPTDNWTAFLTLNHPYRVQTFVKSISDTYSFTLNDNVLRFMGVSGEKIITILLFTIGGMLIALIMIGSVFLIYNSFSISLSERTHQFGILMSVGATEKQLRHAVMFEGLCIGILGIPLGIFIGIPIIQGILSLVKVNFNNILYDNVPLTLVISLPVLAVSIAVTLVTILISAYIPAKKAARTPIMVCIRQTNEIVVDTRKVRTPKGINRFYGMEGTLAVKNFKRNRRRYRSIILSLTLSIVPFVASTVFGTYLNQIADQSSVVVEDYDICMYSRDIEEKEILQLYNTLKTATGVTESHYQALSTYSCTLQMDEIPQGFVDTYGELIGYDGKSTAVDVWVDVQFVDDENYRTFLQELGFSNEDYSGNNQQMLMTGFIQGSWYMQEEPIELVFRDESGINTKTVLGTFVQDYPDLLPSEVGEWHGYTLMVIAPYHQKTAFDAMDAIVTQTKLGLTFKSENPSLSTSEMQTLINVAGITANYHLYNVYSILDQNRNISFIINLFSIVFILMITMIAIANVFNTISTSIKLRRREFAMLRSIGMSDRDFDKMMRFECVIYGVRTMLWGFPISIVLSLLIYRGIVTGGGSVAYVFPWKSLLISIISVILIVFVTMLYGIDRIKRENIIDALRDDMS